MFCFFIKIFLTQIIFISLLLAQDELSIYEIQTNPPESGSEIVTSGTVTHLNEINYEQLENAKTFYVQSGQGPYSAIKIMTQLSNYSIALGDSIVFSGTFYTSSTGNYIFVYTGDITTIQSNVSLPSPEELEFGQDLDSYNAVLVSFTDVMTSETSVLSEASQPSTEEICYLQSALQIDNCILDFSGTIWMLSPHPGAIMSGTSPNTNDLTFSDGYPFGNYSSNACFYDDKYSFAPDGSFSNVQDGETLISWWQSADIDNFQCADPVYPHDGTNEATWEYNTENGTLTLNGVGAYLGLPIVANGELLTTPEDAPESISYQIYSYHNNVLTISIETVDFNGDQIWYTYTLIPYNNPTSLYGTIWSIAPESGALMVGPSPNSGAWWSNTIEDVSQRVCLFDDKYVFDLDGSFYNIQDDETWIEPWQGSDPASCSSPVYPHDGSNEATWEHNTENGTLTLNGVGAYLGLAEIVNAGNLSDPNLTVPDLRTYTVSMEAETLNVVIACDTYYWTFKLIQVESGATTDADYISCSLLLYGSEDIYNHSPGNVFQSITGILDYSWGDTLGIDPKYSLHPRSGYDFVCSSCLRPSFESITYPEYQFTQNPISVIAEVSRQNFELENVKLYYSFGQNQDSLFMNEFKSFDYSVEDADSLDDIVDFIQRDDGKLVTLGNYRLWNVEELVETDIVLKIIDRTGNVLEESYFGGPGPDGPQKILLTQDNGYVIICIEKIIKLDSEFNIQWIVDNPLYCGDSKYYAYVNPSNGNIILGDGDCYGQGKFAIINGEDGDLIWLKNLGSSHIDDSNEFCNILYSINNNVPFLELNDGNYLLLQGGTRYDILDNIIYFSTVTVFNGEQINSGVLDPDIILKDTLIFTEQQFPYEFSSAIIKKSGELVFSIQQRNVTYQEGYGCDDVSGYIDILYSLDIDYNLSWSEYSETTPGYLNNYISISQLPDNSLYFKRRDVITKYNDNGAELYSFFLDQFNSIQKFDCFDDYSLGLLESASRIKITDMYGNLDSENTFFTGIVPSVSYPSSLSFFASVADVASSTTDSDEIYVEIIGNESLNIEQEMITPDKFSIGQNYPNPFNPLTAFSYNIPKREKVTITIHDLLGKRVKTLVNSYQNPGYKTIKWNSLNHLGHSASAGVYFYTIEAGDFRQTKKMILLK